MSETRNDLIRGELTLAGGLDQKLFRLLAAVQRLGSITRAAREVGLSYKGAWEMIDRANNLAPELLVNTSTGGRHGGGTTLTPAGDELLKFFQKIQDDHRQFLTQLNQQAAENPNLLFLFRRTLMKASARNQLFGQVAQIDMGAVNAEVSVKLKGGELIVAAVTKESASALGIQVGCEAVALIKAPNIMIAADLGGYRLSARNQLSGSVERIQDGPVNSEVVIKLGGGDSLAAIVTKESLTSMGLKVGDPALAIFKAGAVILGVAKG